MMYFIKMIITLVAVSFVGMASGGNKVYHYYCDSTDPKVLCCDDTVNDCGDGTIGFTVNEEAEQVSPLGKHHIDKGPNVYDYFYVHCTGSEGLKAKNIHVGNDSQHVGCDKDGGESPVVCDNTSSEKHHVWMKTATCNPK